MTARDALFLLALFGGVALYAFTRTKRGEITVEEITETVVTKVSEARAYIQGEEGLRLTVYQDPGKGKAWTIGWGHKVRPDEQFHPYGPIRTITRAQADALLESDMMIAANAVRRSVKVPITDNQRVALESLAFNIGETAFADSTLVRKLNLPDFAGAVAEFSRWVYDDGKKEDFLVARRAREAKVFQS